jgi:predicted alpha/beta superfamily hydrolase
MTQKSKVLLLPQFRSEKWGNERRIFVYLPSGYEEDEDMRCPVLYMHAGQRIFEPKRPTLDSWNIHTIVDRLIQQKLIRSIIVVGIAHLPEAGANEFFHNVGKVQEELGITCTGSLYEDFIINELKPYVDRHFRTLAGPEHTALMGSSAAALATYHIGLRRPDIFGNIGILSPYFFVNEAVDGRLRQQKLYERIEGVKPAKIWMDIGTNEGLNLIRDVKEVADGFLSAGCSYGTQFMYYEVPDAAHFEKDWGERAQMPILYFFGEIGKAVSVSLHGRTQIGLRGALTRINPIVHFDTGLMMSDLNGRYEVDRPDILNVDRDGTIEPKALGTASVTYLYGNLSVSQPYTVVPYLSEQVEVSIRVEVPPHTPKDSIIYAVTKLQEIDDFVYCGKFGVPRDAGFAFTITRGFRLFETDRDKNERPCRTFIASDDIELHYVVENWIQ